MKATDVSGVLRCKVAVCGDSAVGKTSLLGMYNSKGLKFPKTYNATMGVEVVVAQVPIPDTTLIAELHMLDTSGSDLYKESLPQYWSGVYFAMIVFDITNAESFDSCRQWNEELKKNRQDKERQVKAVLVATKTDLPSQRHVVSLQAAQDWATANGMDFFATSSLPPGKDVDSAFIALAKAFHRSYEEKAAAFIDACRNY